jgi:hypothetical protein
VEIKLSSNPNLLNGYTVQLEAYAASERSERAALVVVRLNGKAGQLDELIDLHRKLRAAKKRCPDLHIVDATEKRSASKRRRGRP